MECSNPQYQQIEGDELWPRQRLRLLRDEREGVGPEDLPRSQRFDGDDGPLAVVLAHEAVVQAVSVRLGAVSIAWI